MQHGCFLVFVKIVLVTYKSPYNSGVLVISHVRVTDIEAPLSISCAFNLAEVEAPPYLLVGVGCHHGIHSDRGCPTHR